MLTNTEKGRWGVSHILTVLTEEQKVNLRLTITDKGGSGCSNPPKYG